MSAASVHRPVRSVACPHPSDRLAFGVTYDPVTRRNQIWVACCECGSLIQDAISKKTRQQLARQEAQP